MRSKAPLALMEQAVMILVFALAAALCLRVFVWSDRTSKRLAAVDRAVVEVQNTAESLKRAGQNRGGDLASLMDTLECQYDKNWELCPPGGEEKAAFDLRVEEAESDVPGLARAHIYVEDLSDGSILFEVTVAWQTEVSA